MKLLFGVLVLGGCLVSPVYHFGGGKTEKEAQHDRAAELTPPVLVADGEWHGEVKVAHIRVWADDEYRAQNVRWERTFGDSLDYANEVLAPLMGIRLEAEYHAWDHHAPGNTLGQDLDDLVQQDPGDGVLTVIGLTSSQGLTSATFEELGLASTPGNHMMLRGYADVEERQIFERYFKTLTADERDHLYTARRRHKGAALLLHELGHNLGAPHSATADTLMYPMYSDHSASFDPDSVTLMRAHTDQLFGRTTHEAMPAAYSTAAMPAARNTPTGPPVFAVTVDATGAIANGGVVLSDPMLDSLLSMSFDNDHDTSVVVKAAKGAPHDVVVHVLDRAKAAGLTHLSISAN
jgi:biopolymer transport protein ExbD